MALNLGIHHQVRRIADHHVHFTGRVGHFRAQAARNFVPHTGIAIFHVVALGVTRAPQFVQIARQAARCTQHHVLRAAEGVDCTDHLALAQQGTMLQVVNARHFGVPFLVETRGLGLVFGTGVKIGQGLAQFFQRGARITGQGQRGVFEGIQFAHVEVDEAHVRVLEGGFGSGGEVTISGANPDQSRL